MKPAQQVRPFPTWDQAFELALTRDRWLALKVPVLLYLSWRFFLPQLWRIGALVVGGSLASIASPGPGGGLVEPWEFGVMALSTAALLWLELRLTIHAFGLWSWPRIASRLIGLVVLPLGLICLLLGFAVILGAATAWLSYPLDEVWAFQDRWAPISSWRLVQDHSAGELPPGEAALVSHFDALSPAKKAEFMENFGDLLDEYQLAFIVAYYAAAEAGVEVVGRVGTVPSHEALLDDVEPCFANWEGVRDWPPAVQQAVRDELKHIHPILVNSVTGSESEREEALARLETIGLR